MRRNLLLSLVSVLALGLMTTAAPAFAENWTPNGEGATLTSKNVQLEIPGLPTLECTATTGAGTLGVNSEVWGLTVDLEPVAGTCSAPAVAHGTWEAEAVSPAEANLVLPNGAATVTITNCVISINASTVPGTWTAGKPSTWKVAGEVNISNNGGSGCPTAKKAKVKATITVTGTGGGTIKP
jgi:hypothetical protein